MRTIRLIVIDDNKEVVENIVSHFSGSETIEVVKTFSNGSDGYEYIKNNRNDFDIIAMDILLPKLDGIAILESMAKENIKKKTIVFSSYKDDETVRKCMEFGVYYYLLKPFSIYSLESRINDCMNSITNIYVKKDNIDIEINDLLHNLGIPSHIRGYKYLRDGITMIYNSKGLSLITKDIYPAIARKYETTSSRVERAIRHAIEVSWLRGDITLMEELFGFSVSCDKAKPTNSEFLSTLADRIKMDKNVRL